MLVDTLEARDPHSRSLLVRLRFTQVVTLGLHFVGVAGLLPIAVVCLVVEDDDVLRAHQVGKDSPEHLPLGLHRFEFFSTAASKQ